jgi:hypothetical protein
VANKNSGKNRQRAHNQPAGETSATGTPVLYCLRLRQRFVRTPRTLGAIHGFIPETPYPRRQLPFCRRRAGPPAAACRVAGLTRAAIVP